MLTSLDFSFFSWCAASNDMFFCSIDYDNQTLPSKFTDYMRTTLPEQIVLKVNGLSWNINLKKDGDEIMLHGDEWEEFANAYSLKNGDILVFKYNRKECFEVWLFDTNNSCEKEASYFVTKNVNHDQAHGCNGQEAQEKLSKDFVATSQRDSDYDDHTLRKRRAKSDFGTSVRTRGISLSCPLRFRIILNYIKFVH